jgi:hypothetical protein
MASAYQELFLEQGTTFNTSITLDNIYWDPIDLVGTVAKSQIKKSYYSANVTAEFTVTINEPTEGIILLSLDAATTSNISPGRYVYDVVTKDSANTISRVLEGIITVTPQVTYTGF